MSRSGYIRFPRMPTPRSIPRILAEMALEATRMVKMSSDT